MTRQRPTSVWLLIASLGFLSASALVGGVALVADPSGDLLNMPVALLENAPFSNYLIPGLILFTVLGLFPLLVFYGVWRRPQAGVLERANRIRYVHWAWSASIAVGLALVVWILVQLVLVGYASTLQPLYGLLGLLILVLCFLPAVRRYFSNRAF